MTRTILSAILLMLVVSSCDFDCLEGRGDLKSQVRKTKPFTSIQLGMNAKVIVTRDSLQSVRVEAQPNVLQVLNTDVSSKCLYINVEGCLIDTKPITVYITTPNIEGVVVNGSGNVESIGNFSPDKIELTINGSGSITLSVNANTVSSVIRGSGDIIVSGSARKLEAEIYGSGNVKCENLAADNVSVDVKGSGDCRVFAISKLDVDVAGSGNVYYKGKPDISSNIAGSGKLEKSN